MHKVLNSMICIIHYNTLKIILKETYPQNEKTKEMEQVHWLKPGPAPGLCGPSGDGQSGSPYIIPSHSI